MNDNDCPDLHHGDVGRALKGTWHPTVLSSLLDTYKSHGHIGSWNTHTVKLEIGQDTIKRGSDHGKQHPNNKEKQSGVTPLQEPTISHPLSMPLKAESN